MTHKDNKKARRNKLHEREVVESELNKSYELYKLYEELNKKTCQVSPYRTFYIYESKNRKVDATPYRDRVVQNCFVDNYLFLLLENRLIYDNATCRKSKGTDFARNRLKSFLLDAYKKYGLTFYVLTSDVHHYLTTFSSSPLKEGKTLASPCVLFYIITRTEAYPRGRRGRFAKPLDRG